MTPRSPPARGYVSFILPVTTIAIAIVIFVVDTLTHFEIAVSALYGAVVLLAVRFLDARGVLVVAAGCIALAVLSHLLTRHGGLSLIALANLIVGILVIGVTTYLALQNQSTQFALREKAGLLDLTHDTMFVRDVNDAITFWNRAAEELYGWKEEEAIGKISHELMQTSFPAPLENILDEVHRVGRWDGDLVHTSSSGTEVTVASRWSLLKDERGRSIAILETNNDITERKRGEEKLQQAQGELARMNRTTTLGELTASIAHEVNQPLAAIVIDAEVSLMLLGRDQPATDEGRDALRRIIGSSKRASEIIQRLRALYKKADPQKAPIDINSLIVEVIPLLQHQLRSHGVSLQTEMPPTRLPILGDRIQLQQVVMNLVLNGMEAMASVTDGPRELLIRSSKNGADQVIIAVRDTGVGIDPGNAERLFNPFFTTKPDGTGMGLSICRSIIEVHGGRVWASRNEGRGATFQFSLPLLQGDTPSALH
jgi:two-component system, LuxR family, sensor kinase FixL